MRALSTSPAGGLSMRRILLLAVLALPVLLNATGAGRQSAPAGTAPPPGLTANVEGRKTTSLNGPWHYIVDPYDNGYWDYRHQPRKDGFFENAKAKTPRDLVEYDFDRSETIQVPGDWNSQKKDLFYYEGTVWYERSFSYRKAPQARVFLYLGAANYLSRIYVNGAAVCEHEGGFTSFNCEVTNQLRDGDNFAVIYVNNNRRRDAVPTDMTDWWNYGGLTRDVALVEVPSAFVEDYFLQVRKGAPDVIEGWVVVNGGSLPVTVRIPELKVEQTVQPGPSGRADVRLEARGLQRWSPEQPKLYDVEV